MLSSSALFMVDSLPLFTKQNNILNENEFLLKLIVVNQLLQLHTHMLQPIVAGQQNNTAW
jgi:hypothetical protein